MTSSVSDRLIWIYWVFTKLCCGRKSTISDPHFFFPNWRTYALPDDFSNFFSRFLLSILFWNYDIYISLLTFYSKCFFWTFLLFSHVVLYIFYSWKLKTTLSLCIFAVLVVDVIKNLKINNSMRCYNRRIALIVWCTLQESITQHTALDYFVKYGLMKYTISIIFL